MIRWLPFAFEVFIDLPVEGERPGEEIDPTYNLND